MQTEKQRALFIGALGVVFGDIGTSPLYALHVTLEHLEINLLNILGILSLIFWTFILVISLKYVILILRADNHGEGGILALFALLKRKKTHIPYITLITIAIVGSSLLFSDGILTPAISVLSAIEGLNVTSPNFKHLVLPLSILIILGLFLYQHKGTGKIGQLFGPIIFLWFIVIAAIGLYRIIENPTVLLAFNPYYAWNFFAHYQIHGYLILSGIFLVVTGGEALYADLGHFGKRAIRQSWFFVVMPCLLCSYFGQGAYLLVQPAAISNPFYSMVPDIYGLHLFMILLATTATIIASQAVISATFSLAKQSMSLDFFPKFRFTQTSALQRGQVYVPLINIVLAVGTILLILIFKTSANLADAYGLAVNLLMFTVTFLVIDVSICVWKWPTLRSLCIFLPLLLIDIAFLGANLRKIETGAYFPLSIAIVVSIIMFCWLNGLTYLKQKYFDQQTDLSNYLEWKNIVPFDAVFLADPYDKTGNVFMQFLELSRQKPRQTFIVNIEISDIPQVKKENQFEIKQLADRCYQIILHYGFKQTINLPKTLKKAYERGEFPIHINLEKALYFTEQTDVIVTDKKLSYMFKWQKKLFALLFRNATTDISYYNLPHDRTVTLGNYSQI